MASRTRRCIVAILVAVAVAVPLVIAPNASAAKNRYGVVVLHEETDATPAVDCVELNTDKVRALDLLNRTSFAMYTNVDPQFGREVCWLDGFGYLPTDHAPGTSCFNASGANWTLWVHRGAADPELAPAGVSTLALKARSVLYLQFAEWGGPPDFEPPAAPPRRSVNSICNPDT